MNWCPAAVATVTICFPPLQMNGAGELVDPVFPWTGDTARLARLHHAAGGGQATAENTHMDGRSHCLPLALAICTSFIGFAATTGTTARLCCVCDLESRDSRCTYVLQRSPSTAAVCLTDGFMTRPGGTIGAGVSLLSPYYSEDAACCLNMRNALTHMWRL